MLVFAYLIFVKVVNGSTKEILRDVLCDCEINSM